MTEQVRRQLQEALQRGYIAAFRLLGDREESQEACHEAAIKALKAEQSYQPDKPFYPWFYRILKNHCLDRLRKRKREGTAVDTELVAGGPSAEGELLAHEQSQRVLQAIERLPDNHREMIELRHFQDLEYEEMAEILGCPVGTVMSRLYRARKALRALLST